MTGIKNADKAKSAAKWFFLVLLCLFSLAVCLFYIETEGKFSESYSPDEGNYIKMAKRLLSEGCYSYWGHGPDAYVSPGFPIFLTLGMAAFGTDLMGIHCIKIVQAFLVSLTVLLTFVLGRQLTKKDSVGLTAAALIALNGLYASYSRRLLTETLYLFTMMLFFVALVFAMQREKKRFHLLAGILFGITVMVRPLVVILGPFLYLPLFLSKRREWKAWAFPLLLFFAGFAAVGLPWWIRNVVSLKELVLLATQTNPIYAGLAPNISALGLENPGSILGNIKLLFQLLFTRPFDTLYWMSVGKFKIIFMEPPQVAHLQTVTVLVKDFTLYAGLLGCARALFTKKYVWPAVIFLIYFLSSFMSVPTSRYAVQYFPLLAIFAGYVVYLVFRKDQPAPAAGQEF